MSHGVAVRMYGAGIGDFALTVPFLAALAAEAAVYVVPASPAQAELAGRCPFVAGTLTWEEARARASGVTGGWSTTDCNQAPDEPRRQIDGWRLIDLVDHPLQTGYWWGSEEFSKRFGHITMYDVLERMFGLRGQYEPLPRLAARPEPGLARTILLAPGGRRLTKLWPSERWLALTRELQDRGWSVATLGAAAEPYSHQIDELAERGIVHHESATIGAALDAISGAAAVVGVDNGLVHLAALQDRPAVALFGPAQAWHWAPRGRRTVALQGACGLNCMRQPFAWRCPWHTCMREIDVDAVLTALLPLLSR